MCFWFQLSSINLTLHAWTVTFQDAGIASHEVFSFSYEIISSNIFYRKKNMNKIISDAVVAHMTFYDG